MKTISKRKANRPIWQKMAWGLLAAVIAELLLTGVVSLMVIANRLPDVENGVYGYAITAIAVVVAVIIFGKGENRVIVSCGICAAVVLIHCANNIIFYSGTFHRIGLSVLAVAIGGTVGILPGIKKKTLRKIKTRTRA